MILSSSNLSPDLFISIANSSLETTVVEHTLANWARLESDVTTIQFLGDFERDICFLIFSSAVRFSE